MNGRVMELEQKLSGMNIELEENREELVRLKDDKVAGEIRSAQLDEMKEGKPRFTRNFYRILVFSILKLFRH